MISCSLHTNYRWVVCVLLFGALIILYIDLWLRDRQVVLSPSWSIHSGCGRSNDKFVRAKGGENQRFDDMDPALIATLH